MLKRALYSNYETFNCNLTARLTVVNRMFANWSTYNSWVTFEKRFLAFSFKIQNCSRRFSHLYLLFNNECQLSFKRITRLSWSARSRLLKNSGNLNRLSKNIADRAFSCSHVASVFSRSRLINRIFRVVPRNRRYSSSLIRKLCRRRPSRRRAWFGFNAIFRGNSRGARNRF